MPPRPTIEPFSRWAGPPASGVGLPCFLAAVRNCRSISSNLQTSFCGSWGKLCNASEHLRLLGSAKWAMHLKRVLNCMAHTGQRASAPTHSRSSARILCFTRLCWHKACFVSKESQHTSQMKSRAPPGGIDLHSAGFSSAADSQYEISETISAHTSFELRMNSAQTLEPPCSAGSHNTSVPVFPESSVLTARKSW